MKNKLQLFRVMLVVLLGMLAFASTAQNVIRDGNTFKIEGKAIHVRDTIITNYEYEDAKGNKYPIICNKTTGACYVMKVSSRTNKTYRYYVKPEISKQICKELNVPYKEK